MVFLLICTILQLPYHVYKIICIMGFVTILVRVVLGGCSSGPWLGSTKDITALGVNLDAAQIGFGLVKLGSSTVRFGDAVQLRCKFICVGKT